jgi:hypothetical protein
MLLAAPIGNRQEARSKIGPLPSPGARSAGLIPLFSRIVFMTRWVPSSISFHSAAVRQIRFELWKWDPVSAS